MHPKLINFDPHLLLELNACALGALERIVFSVIYHEVLILFKSPDFFKDKVERNMFQASSQYFKNAAGNSDEIGTSLDIWIALQAASRTCPGRRSRYALKSPKLSDQVIRC